MDCFGGKVTYVVGVDETSRFGVVVATLQVVQSCFTVVVVTTVTERVEDTCITCSKDYCAIAVSVVSVFRNLCVALVNGNDVAEQVLSVCVQSVVENKTSQTFTVVQEGQIVCLSA